MAPRSRSLVTHAVAGLVAATILASPASSSPRAAPRDKLRATVAEDDTCSGDGEPCSFNALQVSKRRHQDIQIIGTGHPRTGSQSVEKAFEILGYTSTSGSGFQWVPEVRKTWMDWAEGGSFEPALSLLLKDGVTATTADWPASCAWKELVSRYPSAKVILFTHPKGAQGWLHSFESAAKYYSCNGTFRPGMFSDWLNLGIRFFHGAMANMTADMPIPFTPEVREKLLQAYDEDNAEIKRTVPASRLLEYNVGQGWAPLCEYLGKPVPDIPFPHIDTVGGGNLCQDVQEVINKLPEFMREAGGLERLPEVIEKANVEAKSPK